MCKAILVGEIGLWRRKREGVIRDLIHEHAQAVLKTVEALADYVSVVKKKKPKKRLVKEERALEARVLELEAKADEVEEKINAELFRGAFLPVTSSDRYDLVTSIDGIADRCELVVRKLRIVGEPIELDIKDKLLEMTNHCVAATKCLVQSIELMTKNFDDAIAKASSVYPIREKNREVEFETHQLLVKHEMECSTLVILHDVIQLLGQTTDRAKIATDNLVSMIIKYRS